MKRFLFALFLVGCGREDVLLAGLPSDAGVGVEGAAPPIGGDGGADSSSCTARRVCRALGAVCETTGDCCSGRCEGGTCLPASSCSPAKTACAGPTDCCSGRCEPVPGTTNRACTALCVATGAACASGADCCSLSCQGGACAATACLEIGSDCTVASDCCSSVCTNGRCEQDPVALCRASGEDCTAGGGTPCCYGCVNGRCDLGAGVCRPRSAPCGQAVDCCTGTCTPDANKDRFCTSACVADGAACKQSADCCNGACSASPGVCLAASTCALVGSSCTADAACCTGTCLGGVCADTCPGNVR